MLRNVKIKTAEFLVIFLGVFFSMVPGTLFAQVVISEIMYDAPGADPGREWIEIENVGTVPIDISKWKFREADVDHKLSIFQGKVELSPNSFAIIADSPEKFLVDYPDFSGTIFNSSFSLSNEGEEIMLKNASSTVIDTVAYKKGSGASGNGGSLQKIWDIWKEGVPTPGNINTAIPIVKVVEPLKTAVPSPKTDSKISTTKKKNTAAVLESVPNEKVFESKESFQGTNKITSRDNKDSPWEWYAALTALICIPLGIILYVRRKNTPASGYEIVE